MVIKNFERIEIKCTRHDHRLTFRLNKTIAKLAEVVGDDSSLAQDVCFYRWSVGILDVNGTRAWINATATGYEILGKRSARNSKERIPIGEKEIRGATNKNTFISHALPLDRTGEGIRDTRRINANPLWDYFLWKQCSWQGCEELAGKISSKRRAVNSQIGRVKNEKGRSGYEREYDT